MFAVYNNGSVGFRSTVDNLYSLKSLDAPNGVRLKPDDDTLFQDYTNYKKEIIIKMTLRKSSKYIQKNCKSWYYRKSLSC